MGDGTKKNPYTREDVLKLIKQNGGKAEGLDLSGKIFKRGINLKRINLDGMILRKTILRGAHLEKADLHDAHLEEADLYRAYLEKAHLGGAHLKKADLNGANLKEIYLYDSHLEEICLMNAHLERAHLSNADLKGAYLASAHLEGAWLDSANLKGADLNFAHLEKANLWDAHLEGANLGGAQFSPETRLENVDWGNFVLGEERSRQFGIAAAAYRRLKQWYTNAGMYDIAGEFFFREMEAKRKGVKWRPNPRHRAWSSFVSLICGYGERPFRVVASGAVVVFGLALIYFAIGTLTPNTFLNSLYYSAVSFTALGYGSWAPEPTSWVKGLGAFEAFVGVFMIALFLITFTRKMRR